MYKPLLLNTKIGKTSALCLSVWMSILLHAVSLLLLLGCPWQRYSLLLNKENRTSLTRKGSSHLSFLNFHCNASTIDRWTESRAYLRWPVELQVLGLTQYVCDVNFTDRITCTMTLLKQLQWDALEQDMWKHRRLFLFMNLHFNLEFVTLYLNARHQSEAVLHILISIYP